MKRLTYKSSMGDYGAMREYESPQEEIQALRNALGKYEDIGSAEEFKQLKEKNV